MTNSLPTITTKQQEILKLIYRYRFLNRKQIQTLLSHKDKRRIISWLKDLREKEYVDWHYDATDFIAKSKPAIYYLSLNGIRYLRDLGGYPNKELRKRYKETNRTQIFIDRCLLIVDCCIALRAKSDEKQQYTYVLSSDYADLKNEHHFLDELKPHLFFAKQYNSETINYILENFVLTLPRYQLRRRIKDYVDHIDTWDESEGPAPIVLFICATTADLLYVKRRVKKLIEENDYEDLQLRVTTFDKVREHGVAGMIWDEIQ